ncbi:MAG: tetratricopeptide repeat protein [Anaerolineae bacterium]|nr:tetratricopeptide repeat protein [Anaerolineae bacterium]
MDTQIFAFVSSKMLELAPERQVVFELLPTLGSGLVNLRAWAFENDAPASNNNIRQVYLDALENSALYIGIFWNAYGEWTIDEFEHATRWGIDRHIYVKDVEVSQRDPRVTEFLNKWAGVTSGITARWFRTTDELKAGLRDSIELWARERFGRRTNADGRLVRHPDDFARRPKAFIGRERMRQEVRACLDAGQTVLLQGLGGVGKSALAAEIAAQFVNVKPIMWLEAGDSAPDVLLETAARAISVEAARQVAGTEKLNDRIQIVREHLRSARLGLLVLDDLWNERALNALLRALPKDLPLLVTSRRRYPLDALFDVETLAPDEARRLLALHAGHDHADADELCMQLGNLPFALEVAGATLKVNRWTPTELLRRMENRLPEMQMPLTFQEEGRQSVKALLDTSLNTLYQSDKLARAVFLAFGAFFAPSATSELLSLYLNQGSLDNAMRKLEEYALVTRVAATDESREYYRIHDLVYRYAAAQVISDQRSRALDSCLDYMKRHRAASPGDFSAQSSELDNLMGAANWAFSLGEWEKAERFAWDLFGNSEFLDLRGLYTKSVSLLAQAAQAAHLRGDKQSEGRHLGNLGNVYRALAEYQRAIEYHQQALVISREIGNRRDEGSDLGNLGTVYSDLGEYDKAQEYLQQALLISRETGDKDREGNCLGNLGVAYLQLGQYRHAIDYFEQALTFAHALGSTRREGEWLSRLGAAFMYLGEYQRAIEYQQEALILARQIGYKREEEGCLVALGNIWMRLGRYSDAFDCYQQSLDIARQIGNKHGELSNLGNMGGVYLAVGNHGQALDYFQQALVLSREIGDKHGEGDWLGNIGTAYFRLGEFWQAIDYHQQALKLSHEIGDLDGESITLNNLGNAYRSLDEYEQAIEYHRRALNTASQIGNRYIQGDVLSDLGIAYRRIGWYEEALSCYRQALEINRQVSNRLGEGNVLANLGNIYLNLEQCDKALAHYLQAREVFVTLGLPDIIAQLDRSIADARKRRR